MEAIREKISVALKKFPSSQVRPALLLIFAVIAFIAFMLNLQRDYNISSRIQLFADEGDLLTLDEWQAIPFHCKAAGFNLNGCTQIRPSPSAVSFPRTAHIFSSLMSEMKSNQEQPLPNAARLTYRFRINEIDWLKQKKQKNRYLSFVIPRTSQSELWAYAHPDNSMLHSGRGVNAVTTLSIQEILETGSLTMDYNAYEYGERSFGPLTLPIALMVPSRTPAYLGLLQKIIESSLPLTLLSLTLPVLAAALAVILDASRIMLHIGAFAFLKGLKALVTYSMNTLDGKSHLLLGFPVTSVQLRTLAVFTILAALLWQARVIFELIVQPSGRFAERTYRTRFALLCMLLLAICIAPLSSDKALFIARLERVSDILAALFTLALASVSLFFHFRQSFTNADDAQTALDSKTGLFNPTHFYVFRVLLVTGSVSLMAWASWRDLLSAARSALIYDPLDWKQATLVPVLLLSAMLGVGSITQKMRDYARMMRRRVEQLMVGSRTLASSREHAAAIDASLEILSREIEQIQQAQTEVILPSPEPRKLLRYAFKMGDKLHPEPQWCDGLPPIPDEQQMIVPFSTTLTLNLVLNQRWLGVITIECANSVVLTQEERHFIQVTMQTLCLTLDNLTALRELRRADKLKDDFLANTSHELRTPLHGIVGIAESMLNGFEGGLNQKLRENLTLISSSGRRLTNLVNDLLDFSQIKQRELKLRFSQVELRPMVQLILALNEPLKGNKPVELQNDVDPNLPLLEADEERLQQILQNLIGNAIKFTHNGHISVSATAEDRHVRILIKDSGIGIEQSKLQRIFNSFEQADGQINRAYGGTGLGLTITKQLVELHGGHIRVDSTLGSGSEFSFTIPFVKSQLLEQLQERAGAKGSHSMSLRPRLMDAPPVWWAETAPAEQKSEIILRNIDSSSYKILVVDDELINRKVLENQLHHQNYQVIMAEDGPSALLEMKKSKPDLVLLDLMMPRMSGLEVLSEIRKQHSVSELPVIVLTAKNQISDLVSCFGTGANDFLMKPFTQSELLARMKNHLQISKIHGAYTRFIPQDLLQLLGKENIIDVRLGDQVLRDMSVLFLDIRQFSKISETLTPKENFDFLNSYFATVNPVIKKHCGFIDKYIGDSVMALFANRPDDALLAAISLQDELEVFNTSRRTEFKPPIQIGLGVHHGPLMLGTLGTAERMEGTVIADSVNLASRLENMTKVFSVDLITSQDTLLMSENPNQFEFRSLGRVRPPGFSRLLNVVEIFNGDSEQQRELKLKTLARHEEALKAFHRGDWDAAVSAWTFILDENPADRVVAHYLDRAVRYQQNPPPLDTWDGVFEMRGR